MFVFYNCTNLAAQTHTQHARTQGNTHRPSAVSAAKCSCFSSISAHFRFAAWRRHSILCFRRFSPILSVLFLVFPLRWHWHKVYCISNCDAANIFSSDSRILIARLRFLSPRFYRATQKKKQKRIDTSFRGHLELVAREQEQALAVLHCSNLSTMTARE